ncbi:MAG: lamin tail domain-containing protein [Pirellulales bacterium]
MATFITNAPPPIVVTEIMYHPGPPTAAEIAAGFDEDDAFEFIELTNTSSDVIVLDGLRFGQGVEFEFFSGSIHTLAPGDYVLVVSNADAFAARYGTGFAIAGEYRGRLANGGEPIGLYGSFDEGVGSYYFDDSDFLTDGEGFSLINAASHAVAWFGAWQRSAYSNGSPGEGDPFLAPGSLVINEVYASGVTDWIELFNTTDENVEVGGWFLSDDPNEAVRAILPDGLFVPAHGYLVLDEGVHFGFGLSRNGEQLTLTSARDGQPAGYRESVLFDRAEADVSFGRHVKSDGSVDFVRQAALSRGAANAGPLVSPVVINEIMYAPANGGDEFIELFNTSTEDVLLDGWRVTGVNYAFPVATTIAAGGYLVVAPIDPGLFRVNNSVPEGVPVVGPYASALDNAGEAVTLFQPQIGGEVRGDHVEYDNEVPWSMLADGRGASLVRTTATGYGNDAANWTASAAGGTPGAANESIGQTPQAIPYMQGFENPALAELAGWSFAVSEGGLWDAASDLQTPHSGQHHLRAVQTESGDSIQEAMLAIDLAGLQSAQNLALDFWIRRDRDASATGDENYGVLELRGGDGVWSKVAMLRPNEGRYTHYAFDLDAALAAAGIAGQSQAFVRLRHYGEEVGDTMWLDDFRVSQIDFFGPNVIAQSPAGSVGGPVTMMSLSFDDPIDAASFSAVDVRVVGPNGVPIAVTSLTPITPMNWQVTFAPQQLPGVYRVTVGPDITDTAGNPMNQGGATIDGQAVGSSPYHGSFSISTPFARAFPTADGFEAGSLGGLVGWSFDVTDGGLWDVTAQGEPQSGAYHLKSSQSGFARTTKDAVLRLDLSNLAADDGLVLDFWATRIGRLAGNFGGVYASGDGDVWSQIYALSPPIGEPSYFVFDLRAALDTAGIAADDNVYLRFSHAGRSVSDVMFWDDVRVSDEDLFGPRVVAMTPATVVPAPVEEISFTFDEAIDAATLTPDDVRIIDPFGNDVGTIGPAVDVGDGRTFSLALAMAATINGRYRVLVGPDVRDAAGNALNQDGDPISGETNGHDTFAAAFEIGPATRATLPHAEDFEDIDAGELGSWSFATSGSGRWSLEEGVGHNGGDALVARQTENGQATQDAVIALDVASWPADAPIYLDFFGKMDTTSYTNAATVQISGDGESWTWLATFNVRAGVYGYYANDVGHAMASAGISRDGPLYVRFSHFGGSLGDEVIIDNVRLSDVDPYGPYIVSQTPLVETGDASYFDVTFDEPVDAATFTPSDVSITLPGSVATVTDVSTTDNLTFRINLATPGLGGLYTLRIGPDIVGTDGVPMNQDRDTINGETDDDVYAGTLFVRIVPQSLPYAQSFESGSLGSFAGWAFKAQGEYDWGGGDWRIVSTHGPYEGDYHLEATQIADCWTQHDAVLALDLSNYTGAKDLELEFSLQRVTRDERNMAKLLLSGDGSTWTQVGSVATLLENDGQTRFSDVDGDGKLDLAPTLRQYTQYRFDLDRLLAQAGLSTAETVYIDWHRLGFWKDSVTTIDSISVRSLSPPTLVGDLNGDGKVGVADIALLQQSWGVAAGATRSDGDLNGDGAVTTADVAMLVAHLGRKLATCASVPAAIVARSRRIAAQDQTLADWPTANDAGDHAVDSRTLWAHRRFRQANQGESLDVDGIDAPMSLRASSGHRATQNAVRQMVRGPR